MSEEKDNLTLPQKLLKALSDSATIIIAIPVIIYVLGYSFAFGTLGTYGLLFLTSQVSHAQLLEYSFYPVTTFIFVFCIAFVLFQKTQRAWANAVYKYTPTGLTLVCLIAYFIMWVSDEALRYVFHRTWIMEILYGTFAAVPMVHLVLFLKHIPIRFNSFQKSMSLMLSLFGLVLGTMLYGNCLATNLEPKTYAILKSADKDDPEVYPVIIVIGDYFYIKSIVQQFDYSNMKGPEILEFRSYLKKHNAEKSVYPYKIIKVKSEDVDYFTTLDIPRIKAYDVKYLSRYLEEKAEEAAKPFLQRYFDSVKVPPDQGPVVPTLATPPPKP